MLGIAFYNRFDLNTFTGPENVAQSAFVPKTPPTLAQ
jgi:hypothetical protein